jgi:hypothetical protein
MAEKPPQSRYAGGVSELKDEGEYWIQISWEKI